MTDRKAAPPHRTGAHGAATLMVLVSAMGFSTISIATVIATRDGTPLTTVVIGRFALSALILFPLAGGWQALRLPRAHTAKLLLWGGVGQSLINLLNLSALDYIPAATVVFLFYTFPAWVAIVAAVRGTERVERVRVVALLLSLAADRPAVCGSVGVTGGRPRGSAF